MKNESLGPYERDAANLEVIASWEENKNFADLLREGAAAIRCVGRMRMFLSPAPPKDPLEELEEFVSGDWDDHLHPKGTPEFIRIAPLLAEIRRLRGNKLAGVKGCGADDDGGKERGEL